MWSNFCQVDTEEGKRHSFFVEGMGGIKKRAGD